METYDNREDSKKCKNVVIMEWYKKLRFDMYTFES